MARKCKENGRGESARTHKIDDVGLVNRSISFRSRSCQDRAHDDDGGCLCSRPPTAAAVSCVGVEHRKRSTSDDKQHKRILGPTGGPSLLPSFRNGKSTTIDQAPSYPTDGWMWDNRTSNRTQPIVKQPHHSLQSPLRKKTQAKFKSILLLGTTSTQRSAPARQQHPPPMALALVMEGLVS